MEFLYHLRSLVYFVGNTDLNDRKDSPVLISMSTYVGFSLYCIP